MPVPRPFQHPQTTHTKHQKDKMAFCISASTSTFVGAKVVAKPTSVRRSARYVCRLRRCTGLLENLIFSPRMV